MMSNLTRAVLLLTIFSIAMGFMEAAVVIYLRELYYPGGFAFPLSVIPQKISLVELLREAATLIMLWAVGYIAGKNFTERFAFFLFCFGVWDLFYYVFLFVFLDWPSSLLTWDILFLIPVPWIGPVAAPCILAVTMILFTVTVVYFHKQKIFITISKKEWLLLIAGSVTAILSFTKGFIHYYISQPVVNSVSAVQDFTNKTATYIPLTFPWWLFIAGELLIVAGIFSIIYRYRNVLPEQKNP